MIVTPDALPGGNSALDEFSGAFVDSPVVEFDERESVVDPDGCTFISVDSGAAAVVASVDVTAPDASEAAEVVGCAAGVVVLPQAVTGIAINANTASARRIPHRSAIKAGFYCSGNLGDRNEVNPPLLSCHRPSG